MSNRQEGFDYNLELVRKGIHNLVMSTEEGTSNMDFTFPTKKFCLEKIEFLDFKSMNMVDNNILVKELQKIELKTINPSMLEFKTIYEFFGAHFYEFKKSLFSCLETSIPKKLAWIDNINEDPAFEKLKNQKKTQIEKIGEELFLKKEFLETIETIQRFSKNFFSSGHCTREEIEHLIASMDMLIVSYQNNPEIMKNPLQNVANLGAYFNVIFCEVVRQVNLNCSSRGYMLMRLAHLNIMMVKVVTESLGKMIRESNIKYVNAIAHLSNKYDDTNLANRKRILDLELETARQKKEIKAKDEYIRKLEDGNNNLKESIQNGQKFVKFLRDRITQIKNERRILAFKLIVSSTPFPYV